MNFSEENAVILITLQDNTGGTHQIQGEVFTFIIQAEDKNVVNTLKA